MRIKHINRIIFVGFLFLIFTAYKKDKSEDLLNDSQRKLLELVNDYRAKGCKCGSEQMQTIPELKWNSLLEKAAKIHADDMKKMNKMTHEGSDGSNGGERIERVGYNWTFWGENVARGHPNEEEVIKAWIKSETHCRNIMNPNFKEMGVAQSGEYWAQSLGTSK